MVLILDGNLLTSFDFNYLKEFPSIQYLSLRENQFGNNGLIPLDPDTFIDMRELDLSYNDKIDFFNFQHLKGFNLFRIYLDGLTISEVALPYNNGDFNATNFLMRSAHIEILPPLTNLGSITYLYLDYNLLDGLNMETFSELPNLVQLYLDGNPASSITPLSAPNSIPNLDILSYAHCDIQGSLDLGYFVEWMMPKLRVLILDNNQISIIIPPTNYSTLPSLKEFKMSANNLTELKLELFATYTRNVEVIDVSSNLITVVVVYFVYLFP